MVCRLGPGRHGQLNNRRSEPRQCQALLNGPMRLVKYPELRIKRHSLIVPGFGRPNNGNGFGSLGGSSRPAGSRAVTIRLLVCQACEKLTARTPINQNLGWHRADDVLREVQMMKPSHEAPVQMLEMLEICDTEGNGQNGGGSFMTRGEDQVGLLIRFDPGQNTSMSGRGVGDIGSPIVGGTPMPVIGGQRPFQQPGGF